VADDGRVSAPEPQPHQVEIVCPEAMTVGVYANGLSSWFTKHDFTLDFLVNLPAQASIDEEGNAQVRQPFQVVSRVKIPPAILFHLMQNLNQSLTQYEQQFGPIPADGITPPPDAAGGA
jgi:hypothetical protein